MAQAATLTELRFGANTTISRSTGDAVFATICVIILLMTSQGLLGPLLNPDQKEDGGALLRLQWYPVYAFTLVSCLFYVRSVMQRTIAIPILVGLVLLTIMSAAWSIDPSTTLRRAVAISMTTAFGVLLAARYDWRDLLTLFGWTMLILAAASFFVSLFVPSLGVETFADHAGAWKGIWYNKNALGRFMARASFLFAFLAIVDVERRKIWTGSLIMAVFLVLMSTSKTSLLALLAGLGVIGLAALMKRGMVSAVFWGWLAAVLGLILGTVLIFSPAFFLELLGRDATLTGRTDIWTSLYTAISQRPYLGYGYGAFWGEDSEASRIVRLTTQWDVPTAHNGWLETLLSVGLVGTVLFAFSFVLFAMRSLIFAFKGWPGVFAVGYLIQFTVFSVSESNILQQNAMDWVMFVALSVLLTRSSGRELVGSPAARPVPVSVGRNPGR